MFNSGIIAVRSPYDPYKDQFLPEGKDGWVLGAGWSYGLGEFRFDTSGNGNLTYTFESPLPDDSLYVLEVVHLSTSNTIYGTFAGVGNSSYDRYLTTLGSPAYIFSYNEVYYPISSVLFSGNTSATTRISSIKMKRISPSFLQNSSFASSGGWTIESGFSYNSSLQTMSTSAWAGSGAFYQTVPNLPKGRYILRIVAKGVSGVFFEESTGLTITSTGAHTAEFVHEGGPFTARIYYTYSSTGNFDHVQLRQIGLS